MMRKPLNGRKGHTSITRTVWCADCSRREHADENASLQEASQFWFYAGWIKTGDLGWICHDCFNRRSKAMYSEPDAAPADKELPP
jgi:hypothetical protein